MHSKTWPQIVRNTFKNVFQRTFKNKANVANVTKDGLELIVIKQYVFQINRPIYDQDVHMEIVMGLTYAHVKKDGKENNVIWAYVLIAWMENAWDRMTVCVSMVGKELIVVKQLAFHHVIMVLL